MPIVRLLVIAALAGTLLGCGLKGPLVLPDEQHVHKKIGAGKASATPPPATPPPATPAAALLPAPAASPSG